MIFFAILFLVIFYFSYYGFSSYLFPDKKLIQHESLKELKSNVVDIIFNQSFSSYSDSLKIREIKNLVLNDGASNIMIAPIDGYSTEGINLDKNHYGVDIVSKKGDLIKSAQDGMVIFSGYNKESGNMIIISHPFNYFTVYSHCDSLLVDVRDIVYQGDYIATLGATGEIKSGPHLHFEIWHNDTIIDPRNVINKYGELDVSTE
tara:strand:- start:216 stop:827 length:612 start_codon:yes stop_codon:yes gene_type:complete